MFYCYFFKYLQNDTSGMTILLSISIRNVDFWQWTTLDNVFLSIVDTHAVYLTNTNALFVKLIILKTLVDYF